MKLLFKFSILTIAFTTFFACVDQTFDLPPTTGVDPGLQATVTIAELKNRHLPGNIEEIDSLDFGGISEVIIKGTVVADDHSGNWFRSFVIQDETGGIEVIHTEADAYVFYAIGREIFIKCSGLVLSDDNNVIQLGGYIYEENGGQRMGAIINPFEKIIPGTDVGEPTPSMTTINALNFADINTLVQLEGVQFVGEDAEETYADAVGLRTLNRDIENCDGDQITLRSSGFSTFANELTPRGRFTIKAIYSVFGTTKQLFIREITDVVVTDSLRCDEAPPVPCTSGPPVEEELEVDFQNLTDNDNIDISGWTNYAVSSTRLWRAEEFSGNLYAQATAFQDNSGFPMEAWLVTPAFDFSVPKVMSFESAMAFWDHDGLTVWISFDFECYPDEATWEQLNVTLATQADGNHTWVPSGDIDLSAYSGIGVIGFKYVGQGPEDQATSFRLDNIVIEDL